MQTQKENIKHLGISPNKEVKDLFLQNYDSAERNWRWHKEMERYTMFMDLKNIVKMTIPKGIYRSNAILIKISVTFFTELEQFAWKHKRSQ